jgi:hypothetical protein
LDIWSIFFYVSMNLGQNFKIKTTNRNEVFLQKALLDYLQYNSWSSLVERLAINLMV